MNRWRPNGIVTVRGQSCPPWWRCHFCHFQPYSFVPSRGSSCGGGRGDPVCLGVTAIWGHTPLNGRLPSGIAATGREHDWRSMFVVREPSWGALWRTAGRHRSRSQVPTGP